MCSQDSMTSDLLTASQEISLLQELDMNGLGMSQDLLQIFEQPIAERNESHVIINGQLYQHCGSQNTNETQQQQQINNENYNTNETKQQNGIMKQEPPQYVIFSDVQQQQEQPLLPRLQDYVCAPSVPSSDDFPGFLNFEVFLNPQDAKNPWVFSSILNKLFIDMQNVFPVDFKCDSYQNNLYVRAMPLFMLDQHSQEFVSRCLSHSLADDQTNRDIPEDVRSHVMRCHHNNAEYSGSHKEHLSVRARLGVPAMGAETVRFMYQFVCKNSCPSGMNRRPIFVLFTLEDELGNVFGKRKLNVRVCSCPKRDKDKEERDFHNSGAAPLTKKKRGEKRALSSTNEDKEMFAVNLNICGRHNVVSILNNAYDRMSGEIVRHGTTPKLRECLNGIQETLKTFENSSI